MKNSSILLGLFWACAPGLALARVDPAPPPSGIVIHLFGPNSVMSNVLPTGPAPASAAPAGATAPAEETAAAPAESPAPAPAPEPSMGNILHQMFVTGDPNDPPRPSAGRTTERP